MHDEEEVSQQTLDEMTIKDDFSGEFIQTDELSNTAEFLGNLLVSSDSIDLDIEKPSTQDELYEIADELILFLD